MNALTLGLIAALCWGIHDICIRFFSQKTPITACIFTVFLSGLAFQTAVTVTTGPYPQLGQDAVLYALAAGLCFVVATFGLFYAFQRGPVRLVAPTIASYPILSITWSAVQGTPVSLAQIAAVLCIIAGVGAMAFLSDTSDDDTPPKGVTILLAVLAAIGFAGTFALGQRAAELSHEQPSTLLTRVFAFAIILSILLLLRKKLWPGKAALPWLIAMGIADGVALLCVVSAGGLPNAHYAAVSSSLFGMITILLAWLLLKERMTPAQWAGCALAFAGVGYLAL
ncbi:MAG: DMT family transporter [Pseudomonadota bacterium]